MTEEPTANLIETASAGVQDLASAATAALEQAGPAGALLQPVVDALRNVWEGYFGSPLPPGGTNWNAYTHEQLYQMLWQGADVGEVSTMAAEWGRHSTALAEHADSMNQQREALQSNWSSQAGELAANRLGELGGRTSDVSRRAGTVQQATQEAGDALSVARNAMPEPPGDPTALVASSAAAGAGAGALVGTVVGAAAGGVGAGPGAVMGAALGAVAAGGGSLFLSHVAAAEQKAVAVHVMQRYESSLDNSSRAIAPPSAAGAAAPPPPPGAAAQTSSAGFSGAAVTGGGAPWGQLIGANNPEPRLSGGLVGAAPMAGAGAAPALAGGRGAGRGGAAPMAPGTVRRGEGTEDQEHQKRLPTIDQKLFEDDRPASAPVIGL